MEVAIRLLKAYWGSKISKQYSSSAVPKQKQENLGVLEQFGKPAQESTWRVGKKTACCGEA
jgi:hypothetical protein